MTATPVIGHSAHASRLASSKNHAAALISPTVTTARIASAVIVGSDLRSCSGASGSVATVTTTPTAHSTETVRAATEASRGRIQATSRSYGVRNAPATDDSLARAGEVATSTDASPC